MTLDQQIAAAVQAGDLDDLFLGILGWDRPVIPKFQVEVDGSLYSVRPVAQKRGLHVLHIPGAVAEQLADLQYRIDMRVAPHAPERLSVFSHGESQTWRWPQPRRSGTVKLVSHSVDPANPAPALIQRLAAVRFTLADEDGLSLTDVRQRLRSQFSADELTSEFYRRFEESHSGLRDTIEGVPDAAERRWYASVLMNRIMFIYFLQKKGFVNGDRDYLRTCLTAIRRLRGNDEFYGFYRDVLLPMFHEGFGAADGTFVDADVAAIVGKVPYVNGGIFEEHPIEADHVIAVPDIEFEKIFAFFDSFRWHLDDREGHDPNAINPDVLGYIFEKYINVTTGGQREGGAYYTKEDVTGYMASSTVVPWILDGLVEDLGLNPVLGVQAQPDRYIPEALRYGVDAEGKWLAVPPGVPSACTDITTWADFSSLPHDATMQLPHESWIETLDRRARVDDLRRAARDGELASVDDFITANLDLETLLLDLLHGLAKPQDVMDAWRIVSSMRVMDPACGSGAFLFAALDVLEDVYAAVLSRARAHVATGDANSAAILAPLVDAAAQHPNDGYYLRKHATLSNLFGVDLMPEAVETAKLRLFLSLAAELHDASEIEPLPDLDFSLRAGNTVVGLVDVDDARERVGSSSLEAMMAIDELAPRLAELVAARDAFVAAQEDNDHDLVAAEKQQLELTADLVRLEADRALAASRGVRPDSADFEEWLARNSPLHWLVEFPEAMGRGGFDVVLGNPPYVARRRIDYDVTGFETDGMSDIYGPVLERSLDLLAPGGRLSMILPIRVQFSDRDIAARRLVLRQGSVWMSTYSRNPSALFTAGLGVRNAIAITSPHDGSVHTTETRRWQGDARPHLFPTARYSALDRSFRSSAWMPRTGEQEIADLLRELVGLDGSLGMSVVRSSRFPLGFKATALYYLPVYTEVPPVFTSDLKQVPPPKDGKICFATRDDRTLALALLAGELSVLWWASTGDDFDVTGGGLKAFPIPLDALAGVRGQLLELGRAFEKALHQPENLLFTPYNQMMTGAWDLRRLRPMTREIDSCVLSALGLERFVPAVQRGMHRFAKSTGERPGTYRGMDWLDARRTAAGR